MSLIDNHNKVQFCKIKYFCRYLPTISLTQILFVSSPALNHLMKWLDQDDRELKLTTVGVMVNTMPDEDKRNIFKQDKGLEK